MTDPILILGVDPGETTGLAMIEWTPGGSWRLERRWEVPGSSKAWDDSLGELYHELRGIVGGVTAVAMEELLVSGIRSRKERPEAQGIIRLVAHLYRTPLNTYAPTTIRSCICGTGRADDAGVKATIRFLLGVPRSKKGEAFTSHQVDAVAVALTELRIGQGLPLLARAGEVVT